MSTSMKKSGGDRKRGEWRGGPGERKQHEKQLLGGARGGTLKEG